MSRPPKLAMPDLIKVNMLHHQAELVHINFRTMRQKLETELTGLKSQIAAGANVETAMQRITKLIALVRAAKVHHQQLVHDLKLRAKYWMQYECISSCDITSDSQKLAAAPPSPFELAIDLPVIVPVANYLCERGCYPLAVQQLLKMRPEITSLVDLESTASENELIEYYKRMDYEPILKWCRVHRSILRKTNSKLELNMQLKEYRRLIAMGNVGEALSFGRRAFSKMNSVDCAAVMEVTSLFYKKISQPGLAMRSSRKSTMVNDPRPHAHISLKEIQRFVNYSRNHEYYLYEEGNSSAISEIQQAVRQVHRRPRQSPLISQVLLSAAVLKTRNCQPGNHNELEALFDGYSKNKCPLCRSIKMEPLYNKVPFAIHTRSKVDSELVMLPPGEVWTTKAFKRQQRHASPSLKFGGVGHVIKAEDIKPVYAL